jgi:hypothetical protein
MSNRDLICEAITTKQLLRFNYSGYARVVEPHLLGYDKAMHDVLCAYLVGGFTKSQQANRRRMYLTAEMSSVQILNETFPGPRKGYNPNDNRMVRVYCRLPRG